MVPSLYSLVRTAAWSTADAWGYVLGLHISVVAKIRYGLLAPMFMLALVAGQYLGAHMYSWLPRHNWLRRVDHRLRVGV